MQKVEIHDLHKAVSGLFEEELKLVSRNAEKISKEVADETCQVIKQEAGFQDRTGKYIRSIKVSTEQGRIGKKTYIISAKNDQYRLTHLLEDGHKTRKTHGKYGKTAKTAAFPHFTIGAEYADRALDQKVKEIVSEN